MTRLQRAGELLRDNRVEMVIDIGDEQRGRPRVSHGMSHAMSFLDTEVIQNGDDILDALKQGVRITTINLFTFSMPSCIDQDQLKFGREMVNATELIPCLQAVCHAVRWSLTLHLEG